MGRPTEKRKNKAVGLRISEDLWAFLAAEDGNVSEKIREILESYVKQKGSYVKQNEGFVKQKTDSFVKQNAKNVVNNSVNTTYESVNTQLMIPERIYNDFLVMAKCFGMRYEIFMSEINRLLNEGNLYVDDGKMHSKDSKLNTEAFFKKCEELGCRGREQDVMDKLVKGMVVKK